MARLVVRTIGVVIAGAVLMVQPLAAQDKAKSLGSVNVIRKVVANGQPLAAGTYTLRLLPEDLSKVVGQTPAESRWVEFVKGGKVVGKEVATVLTGPEAKTVTKGGAPASGSSKTEMLKGNDYVRIWVNQGGTQYLVHLAIAKS